MFHQRAEAHERIAVPVYSGKQIVNGLLRIFSSNKSFLFKNRIIEVSVNHLLLQIESNNFSDSCIRFWKWKWNAWTPNSIEKYSSLIASHPAQNETHLHFHRPLPDEMPFAIPLDNTALTFSGIVDRIKECDECRIIREFRSKFILLFRFNYKYFIATIQIRYNQYDAMNLFQNRPIKMVLETIVLTKMRFLFDEFSTNFEQWKWFECVIARRTWHSDRDDSLLCHGIHTRFLP